jgi:hypothetical protein
MMTHLERLSERATAAFAWALGESIEQVEVEAESEAA